MKHPIYDCCGNELRVDDRVYWYEISVSNDLESQSIREYKGKILQWFGKSLVVLPDYALLALAPINYVKWIDVCKEVK